MKITFLGAGAYGTALSRVANYNGHETKFYDPFKFPDISLNSAIAGADAVVYVAPSEKSSEILPHLDKKTPLICASKGFLSQKPFSEFTDFSVLSGASFADSILKTLTDADTADTTKTNTADATETADAGDSTPIKLTGTSDLITQIFSTEEIIIEHTTDVAGVLLCGALKNIYAIGAGYHSSEPSMAFLENALSEMAQVLEINGADKETLRLSCGAADLVLTCSDSSRNFRYGQALKKSHQGATAQKPELTEGVSAILHLEDYPDFKIPRSATTLKDIIKLVKETAPIAKKPQKEENATK